INELFRADYAVTASNNFSPISTASAEALRTVPGVETVAGVRAGSGRAFGSTTAVTGVPPDVSNVISVKWQEGSHTVPATLGEDGAIVEKEFAKENHLKVGSPLIVETPSGKFMDLQVHGVFAPPKGNSPYGDVGISTTRFDAEYQNPQNVYAFV